MVINAHIGQNRLKSNHNKTQLLRIQQRLSGLYKKRLFKKTSMDFRTFLPDLTTWTLGEMACAAGVLALSAGAGYCLYRGLVRKSTPTDPVQPAQEPVDLLGDSTHTPTFLQVIELNQLLPTEPHQEPAAVDLVTKPSVYVPNDWISQPLGARELNSASYNVQFLSADFYGCLTAPVSVKRYFLGMMRGPETRLCWFQTTETRYMDHDGFPHHINLEDSFTCIQHVSGRVTEFISLNRDEKKDNLPLDHYVQTLKTVTCTYLYVGADGRKELSTWTQEHDPHCTPYGNSESEPDFEEDSRTPEEKEVPFICSHLAENGIKDIGLKLSPLRQAFSTLLASVHNLNFFFVVGKKIAMRLAVANNQDAVGVQLAYEALIRFLRQASNQQSIQAELSEARVQHYNFVDIFFELLLFGCFLKGEAPEAYEGGFLERLFELISMWNIDEWQPAAELYFAVLIDQLTVLCEALFSQPVELYSDPAALAGVISRLVCQYVQLMMDTLEKL